MKNPIHKGVFYYEISILMFVIMWKHDGSYNPIIKPHGLTIGPLYIWINKYWWGAIRQRIRMIVLPIKHRIEFIRYFLQSTYAFLKLAKDGFRISYYDSKNVDKFEIYRFWWNEQILSDFPDIDCIDGHYVTLRNGHSIRITK